MAQFDLTRAVAPFLDRHLLLPLLQFTAERKVRSIGFRRWVIRKSRSRLIRAVLAAEH